MSVASIRASASATLGHVLIVEGLPYIWTDVIDIAGTSWIGGSDGRTVLAGLTVPPSLTVETDLQTGLLRESTVKFGLLDNYDDDLAALFGVQPDESEQVGAHVGPSTEFATDEINLTGTANTTTIYERHIGLERIGSNGERRSWYITPTDTPPGMDHAWIESGDVADVPPVFVSDNPQQFAGRRVGLYQIAYDPDSNSWPSLSLQYAGGALIWVGTMTDRGMMVEPGRFEIECSGPASWTRRILNRNRAPVSYQVQPSASLDAAEAGIAVWFRRYTYGGGGVLTEYDASLFNESYDITETTRLGILSEVRTVVNETEAGGTAVNSTASSSYDSAGSAAFEDGFASIAVVGNDSIFGTMNVALHARAWAVLGWDPVNQPELRFTSTRYVSFQPLDPTLYLGTTHGGILDSRTGSANPLDLTDYYVATFHTYNPDISQVESEGADNDGQPRTFRALYPDGGVSLLPTSQTINLGADDVYLEGQKAQPPELGDAAPLSGADSMGWFLFTGKIARSASQFDDLEFEDYAQIARCQWVDNNGKISQSSGWSQLRIVEWENPRVFGMPYDRMTAPWNAGGETAIACTPITVFEDPNTSSGGTHADRAHRVLSRTLLSSGTSGAWSPLFSIPPAGDNQPTGALGWEYVGGDIEIADLGLAIPSVAVDFSSFADVADASMGTIDEPLNRCKYAYAGPVQSEDLITQIMSSRGWAFSWRKASGDTHPKWGIFDIAQSIGPGDVEIALTESDKAGDVNDNRTWVSPQQLRYYSPIDEFKIETRSNILDGATTSSTVQRSLDPGARGRAGKVAYSIEDPGLSNPDEFPFTASNEKWHWRTQFRERFGEQIGGFFGKRNALLTIRVSAPKGQFLYPGTVVSVTDPRPLNSRGGYSYTTATGRVIGTTLHLSGKWAGCTTAQVLIQRDQVGTSLAPARTWGPSARVYAYDSTTLYIDGDWGGDWLGMGGSHDDATAYSEPSYSSAGGQCKLWVYQSEDGGETWGTIFVCDVTASDASAGTLTYTNAAGNALLRDTDKIAFVAPNPQQDASEWPDVLFSVYTENIGATFNTGAENGWRLS